MRHACAVSVNDTLHEELDTVPGEANEKRK